MRFKIKNSPPHWVLWHPHQRIWNSSLFFVLKSLVSNKRLVEKIKERVITLDTFILGLSLKLMPRNVNRRGYSSQKQINYFDFGTYLQAEELNWANQEVLSKLPNPKNIYAFEANPQSYRVAVNNVKSIAQLSFFNLALVNKVPESGLVRLYTSKKGLGDSIYRAEKGSFVEVPAVRLSDFIREHNIPIHNSINIIRMNIEGCEFDVMKDLAENDLVKYFDGFYGMWDDVGKIDYEKDKEFRKLLKRLNVHPFPFNGRDMKYDSRKNLIVKSLKKSILG